VQKKVYEAISDSGVMDILIEFSPVLAGTFPIGINIPGSDLDIICSYRNPSEFIQILEKNFNHFEGYSLIEKVIRGEDTVIARFIFKEFKFEIFAQSKAVEDQYAYRHMVIEFNLLKQNDEEFSARIIELKKEGLSTEEAFAGILGIKGDPYDGLLDMSNEY